MGGRIVVFGSYVTDLTGRGTRFPVPGETVLGASFQMGPGGKGSNQAVAAFRAGGDVTLVTKLGRDAFGRAARDFYTAEGMNTGEWIEDETCETGAALIMVNQQSGQNMIMVLNGACSHITPEDVRAKQTLIEQADVLLVQMEINVDALEHVIILGQGGERMSAAGLNEEVERAGAEISSLCRKRTPGTKNYLFDHLPEDMADWMEEIRLGRRQWPDKSGEQ